MKHLAPRIKKYNQMSKCEPKYYPLNKGLLNPPLESMHEIHKDY